MNYRHKSDLIQHLVSSSNSGVVIADEERKTISPWLPLNMVATPTDYELLPWYLISNEHGGWCGKELIGSAKEPLLRCFLEALSEK